ncbi:hypothetical protein D9M68_711100 [compost metagenome]
MYVFTQVFLLLVATLLIRLLAKKSASDVSFVCTPTSVKRSIRLPLVTSPLLLV